MHFSGTVGFHKKIVVSMACGAALFSASIASAADYQRTDGTVALIENRFDSSPFTYVGPDLAPGTTVEGTSGNRAPLSYGVMPSADLSGSTFRYVRFEQSILDDASFRNAQLESVNFMRASLSRTDFTGASLTNTVFFAHSSSMPSSPT